MSERREEEDTGTGEQGIKGAVEDLKGRAKEAAGAVLGEDSLKKEGSAQQEKAEAEREAQEAEERARRARERASVQQDQQRREQSGG